VETKCSTRRQWYSCQCGPMYC